LTLGVQENPFQVKRVSDLSLSVPALARGSALPIDYSVARPAELSLAVYDAAGRELKKVDIGPRAAGRYSELLTGLPQGQTLFVKLTSGNTTATRKAVLLR